jgi:hypothetical protein
MKTIENRAFKFTEKEIDDDERKFVMDDKK